MGSNIGKEIVQNVIGDLLNESRPWPQSTTKPFPACFSTNQTSEEPVFLPKNTTFKEEEIAEDEDSSLVDEEEKTCPYKDNIILFILSSEDEELDSAVLSLSPDMWQELNKECQVFEKHARELISPVQTTADKAKEDIARKLGNLHKKTKINLLTEIRVLGAKKTTYIRASTIKKHLRKGQTVPASKRRGYFRIYKVKKEEIKQAIKNKAFITKQVIENKDGTKTMKRVHFKNVNTKEFKGALMKGVIKALKEWYAGDKNPPSGPVENTNLGKLIGKGVEEWVAEINQSLYARSEHGGQVPLEEIHWDWSRQAQILRYYFSGKAEGNASFKKMEINATLSGTAQISVAEAYASCTYYFPNKEGLHGEIQLKSCKLDFGYLRAHLTLEGSGFVGASLMGSGQIGLKFDQNTNSLRIKPLEVPVKGSKKESGVKASIEAFAGVEAGGKVTGELSWHSPEVQDFRELFTVGVGLLGAAGVGGDAEFYITYSYEARKIQFRAKSKLVVGLGAGGELVGSVAVKNNWEFITFVYHQLNKNNFSYLEFLDEGAYTCCVGFALMVLEKTGDAIVYTKELIERSDLYKATRDYYNTRVAEQVEVKKLAKNINSKPDILKFSLPEAQGAMLYKLTESFWFSLEKGVLWDREEEQEDAILVILKNIQTKKEFRKVVERITPDGKPGNYHSNLRRLTGFGGVLDGEQLREYNNFRQKLSFLLKEDNYPSMPNSMQPLQQRIIYV